MFKLFLVVVVLQMKVNSCIDRFYFIHLDQWFLNWGNALQEQNRASPRGPRRCMSKCLILNFFINLVKHYVFTFVVYNINSGREEHTLI